MEGALKRLSEKTFSCFFQFKPFPVIVIASFSVIYAFFYIQAEQTVPVAVKEDLLYSSDLYSGLGISFRIKLYQLQPVQ